jgi:hypothetical protein
MLCCMVFDCCHWSMIDLTMTVKLTPTLNRMTMVLNTILLCSFVSYISPWTTVISWTIVVIQMISSKAPPPIIWPNHWLNNHHMLCNQHNNLLSADISHSVPDRFGIQNFHIKHPLRSRNQLRPPTCMPSQTCLSFAQIYTKIYKHLQYKINTTKSIINIFHNICAVVLRNLHQT